MIPRHRRRQSRVQRPPVFTEPLESRTHLDALPAWVDSGSAATWNATTHTLNVTGTTVLNADPGEDLPHIVAGAGASLTFAPVSELDVHIASLNLTDGATATLASLGANRTAGHHRVLVIESGKNEEGGQVHI